MAAPVTRRGAGADNPNHPQDVEHASWWSGGTATHAAARARPAPSPGAPRPNGLDTPLLKLNDQPYRRQAKDVCWPGRRNKAYPLRTAPAAAATAPGAVGTRACHFLTYDLVMLHELSRK